MRQKNGESAFRHSKGLMGQAFRASIFTGGTKVRDFLHKFGPSSSLPSPFYMEDFLTTARQEQMHPGRPKEDMVGEKEQVRPDFELEIIPRHFRGHSRPQERVTSI